MKVFMSLNIIVRPTHGFEFDMPDLEGRKTKKTNMKIADKKSL
jgi:hypothetical protein